MEHHKIIREGTNGMDNFIGKHLLVDCYGCIQEEITSSKALLAVMNEAAANLGMAVNDTFFHENEEEITVAAYGDKAHVCIHAYPKLGYAAIDIYSFDTDIAPASTMAVIRSTLEPEKIRATSVKRGNIDPDMKPHIRSRSTAMHKFKNTSLHVSQAGKKVADFMVHRNEKRDTLGPE